MAAKDFPISAIAFQLTAALDGYEADVERLITTWLDMQLYQEVSAAVDQIKVYCAALPRLSVAWVTVLISHTELMHCAWKTTKPGAEGLAAGDRLRAMLDDHLANVQALRAKSTQLLARSDA